MNKIEVEEKYILQHIKDSLLSVSYSKINTIEDIYHHNTNYNNLKSVLENGLLNLESQKKQKIRCLQDNEMNLLSDIESHVNGVDGISLSVMNLTDLYRDELEYNPYDESLVDIIISDKIKAVRNCINYGNEFICYHTITQDMMKSVDIRLIDYINKLKNREYKLNNLINNYNSIIEASKIILDRKLNLQLREMSNNEVFNLDIQKVKKLPLLKNINYQK